MFDDHWTEDCQYDVVSNMASGLISFMSFTTKNFIAECLVNTHTYIIMVTFFKDAYFYKFWGFSYNLENFITKCFIQEENSLVLEILTLQKCHPTVYYYIYIVEKIYNIKLLSLYYAFYHVMFTWPYPLIVQVNL